MKSPADERRGWRARRLMNAAAGEVAG